MRQEKGLDLTIRLKTVLMDQNLDEAEPIARFATAPGTEVFYQPIEQNYNTAENPRWFEESANWPKDVRKAVAVVRRLLRLKQEGLHIANSAAQLEAMATYFEDPAGLRVAVQSHSAHERRLTCAALTTLQLQANGDVTVCTGIPPVGNIKRARIRDIWDARARVWESGCCLERRLLPAAAEEAEVAGAVS